jgi:hypothetical protein
VEIWKIDADPDNHREGAGVIIMSR